MRLVDAHELIKNKFKNPISYAAFCNLVGRQPTVDAVPVVRCKDCKYNPNPQCGNAACVLFYGMTDQMGFCHHGERREQE